MSTEIEIRVGLKSGMADPEGANVQKALNLLGFENVDTVKSAKCYRVVIDGNQETPIILLLTRKQSELENQIALFAEPVKKYVR